MNTATHATAKPVRLEVNRTGLWHPVCDFDAGDELAEQQMRQGVEALALIDHRTAFRVITCDPLKSVLITYSAKHGWVAK